MEFTWSKQKRALNLKEHGLDFIDARSVFEAATYTYEDDLFSYGEQRFITRPAGWYPSFNRPHGERS